MLVKNKKRKFVLLMVAFVLFFVATGNVFAKSEVATGDIPAQEGGKVATNEFIKARVLAVGEMEEDEFGISMQKVKVLFLEGELKGKTKKLYHYCDSALLSQSYSVKAGDKVLLLKNVDVQTGEESYHISDYLRSDALYILCGVFVILLVIIGKKKGLFSVISLIFTLGIIFYGAVPMIIKEYNPVLVAVGSSVIITIFTLLLIGGVNVKSVSAILGTTAGTIIAGVIAIMVGRAVYLTGLSLDETRMLIAMPNGVELNAQALLFAGIIWGALGAVMDVGMSIASSMSEIYTVNDTLTFQALLKSGMNVGRDIMSTMSNTLILAYAGTAIPMILVMIIYNGSSIKLVNLDVVATEIVRALSGSIGLLMAIPMTALISAYLLKLFGNGKEYKRGKH